VPRRPSTDRHFDNPVITLFRQHEKVEDFFAILREHDYGNFRRSAGLVDEILTDDRIAGVFEQRTAALKAAPLVFEPAGERRKQRSYAEEIGGKDKQSGMWRSIVSSETIDALMTWGLLLGVAVAQIVWKREPRRWTPTLEVWHPQFLRWDVNQRRFMLQTANRGEVALPRPDQQPRGDGHWFVWCPYGVQYGWTRGLIRSLGLKYVSRSWNETSWDRHVERQGLGIIKGIVPGTQEDPWKKRFQSDLSNIGSEPAILCPQGPDGKGYDVKVEEFTARTWEGMKERKSTVDIDIAVRVLGQNLTTQVDGGSLAASRTHDLIRLDKAIGDAEIGPALRAQVLTWDAEYNRGDPELACWPTYYVEPPDDDQGEAMALKTLGEALLALQDASPRVDIAAILEEQGVPMLSEEEVAAIEADEAERMAAAPDPAGVSPEEGSQDNGALPPNPKVALSAATGIVNRYKFAGLEIAVENPAGTIRLWAHPDGRQGSTKMLCDYGFIEGALSGDEEEVDVYVGPEPEARDVYVVHQLRTPDYKAHDEDKVMLGFPSLEAARACYAAHRDDAERAISGISVIPLERFRAKLRRRGAESTRKIHASVASTARALVALASSGGADRREGLKRRSVAGRRRASSYQDKLLERGIARAARQLAPQVAGLKAEIDKADSLYDLREKVVRRFRDMDPAPLAKIIGNLTVMADLAGQKAARDEV
jgi:phage gp29-like protein